MNSLVKGVIAYKALDHYFTSADARLSSRTSKEHLEYLKARDNQMIDMSSALHEKAMVYQANDDYENRRFQDQLLCEQRALSREMAWEAQQHDLLKQERDHEMREIEIAAQERMVREKLASSEYIAKLQSDTEIYNADKDREARLMMHARELDQNEQLELRRLRVKENIVKQEQELRRYLNERDIHSQQEIERFKILAFRETQILISRENAYNLLQDRMVQEAIRTFPLDISPIVILRSSSRSLTGLLRFSSHLTNESGLPNVGQVYNDVKSYSENPEPLNIFIAPIHIDSKIQNREKLSQQIWDSIYQNIESFFTQNYNRRGNHPVILYPTSWKDKTTVGQHASETLHFFLKDLPSIVIEPRFDGHTFSLMLSMWNIGYSSNAHIRTEMNSGVNLDAMLIKAAYDRSKKSIKLIDELGNKASSLLSEKRRELNQNIEYYECLNLDEKIESAKMEEINAVGVYNLFHIDPVQDMSYVAQMLSEILCVNLAVLADIHHLQSTDIQPTFPSLFKSDFQNLYEDKEFRNMVFQCYKKAYISLRNEDSAAITPQFRKEMEHVREMQIANLEMELELIDEDAMKESFTDKVTKYASTQMGIHEDLGEEFWRLVIANMTVNDVQFFREILPNINDRRLFKQIEKRILDLRKLF